MNFARVALSLALLGGTLTNPALAASPYDFPFDVIVDPNPVPSDADLLDTCVHLNVTLSRVAPPLQTPVGIYNTSTVIGNVATIPQKGLRHACVATFYGVKRGARYFILFIKGTMSHRFKPVGGWFNPFVLGTNERGNPVTKHPFRELRAEP